MVLPVAVRASNALDHQWRPTPGAIFCDYLIASNTRRKAKERAIDTMVYAERMIMRSLRHRFSAPQGFVAVVTPHNSGRCSPRQAWPSACLVR